jgi:hypothetical protein
LPVLARRVRRLEAVYERKLEALNELRQSLLHQAFGRELWMASRVNDIVDQ